MPLRFKEESKEVPSQPYIVLAVSPPPRRPDYDIAPPGFLGAVDDHA